MFIVGPRRNGPLRAERVVWIHDTEDRGISLRAKLGVEGCCRETGEMDFIGRSKVTLKQTWTVVLPDAYNFEGLHWRKKLAG